MASCPPSLRSFDSRRLCIGIPATIMKPPLTSQRQIQGPRGMATAKKGSEGGPSLFDQWLAANPLPESGPNKENVRSGSDALKGGLFHSPHQAERCLPQNANLWAKMKHVEDEKWGITDIGVTSGGGTEGQKLKLPLRNDRLYVKNMEVVTQNVNNVTFDGKGSPDLGEGMRGPSEETGTCLGSHRKFLGSLASGEKQRWWRGSQQKWAKFSWRETGDVLYDCLCECGQMVWDNKHKRFLEVSTREGAEPLSFIPPLIQPPSHLACTPSEYLEALRQTKDSEGRRLLLALVSSSAAALGVFDDDALVLHKVITAYTVRAKQGKAQLHHLRQGGPGRMSVGGGIRARETERLFSRICEKLDEWRKEIECCDLLFFSGNMRVWNEVYASIDPKIPLARDDGRWCKVPYSVRQPRLRELQRVYYGLSHGAVGYGVVTDQSYV